MDARLGLVVATYHRPIVEEMERLAIAAAEAHDAEVVETIHVPGVFDTVLATDRLARRSDIDAVVTIGAIIAGETDHDQVIGHAVANQLQAISRDRDTPVTLGISGPGMTAQVANERVEYGANAVVAAIDLVETLGQP